MRDRRPLDGIDRQLVALLEADASASYAALAETVGLSPGAAHNRVRALRERGVIVRTTVQVDPHSLGKPVLAFALINAAAWMGDDDTADELERLHWIEEAHIIAGASSLLVKIRAENTSDLQRALRAIFQVPGVTTTESLVVLETIFDRPPDPHLSKPA